MKCAIQRSKDKDNVNERVREKESESVRELRAQRNSVEGRNVDVDLFLFRRFIYVRCSLNWFRHIKSNNRWLRSRKSVL